MAPLVTPRLPSGVLELQPGEQAQFQRLLDLIRATYEQYGFAPLETPAFELADVLLTKSGGETEKQVYFVQSTGALEQGGRPELALRFDLTVPLARFVATHERTLPFPFRRYQMQRVYRGERAQKGRFREFYQCDIDIIGRERLDPAHDAECPAIISAVFRRLGIGAFRISISNRKILRGLLLQAGLIEDAAAAALRAIDKLDKIGPAAVQAELGGLGLSAAAAPRLLELLTHDSDTDGTLAALDRAGDHPLLVAGRMEIRQLVADLRAMGVPAEDYALDLTIARGLDYYTGTVYETRLLAHPELGSICSGGRYDDLASLYTSARLPGVGISIGATRLFDQLRQLGPLPTLQPVPPVLMTLLDPELRSAGLELASTLRMAGVAVECWLEPAKLDKQLRHADRRGLRFVLLLGPDEIANEMVSVRDRHQGDQQQIARGALLEFIQGRLRP